MKKSMKVFFNFCSYYFSNYYNHKKKILKKNIYNYFVFFKLKMF